MSEYMIQGETLTAIADAIRSKTGTTGTITAGGMAAVINTISAGSGVELGDEIKYVACNVNPDAGTTTVHKIIYDNIYADTGVYDVVIPDVLAGNPVVINSNG